MVKKIVSLQSLRCIAFLIIFFAHAGIIDGNLGGMGVSIFLVLSGFVMQYGYWQRSVGKSFSKAILFSIKKVRKLYPLHLLMMCFVLFLLILSTSGKAINARQIFVQIFANLFLLKAFIPKESIYFSLNGVSWYLSVCVFLYLVFPFVKEKIKNFTVRKAFVNIGLLYLAQIVIAGVILWFCDVMGFQKDILVGMTYISPFFRLIDFVAGCNLCVIVKKHKSCRKDNIYTYLEIFAVIVTITMSYLLLWVFPKHNNVFTNIFSRSAVLYLPVSLGMVYLFAVNKGAISRILTNKISIQLAELSPYAFLIHTVVMKWVKYFVGIFCVKDNKVIYFVVTFLVTIACSIVCNVIQNRFGRKRLIG